MFNVFLLFHVLMFQIPIFLSCFWFNVINHVFFPKFYERWLYSKGIIYVLPFVYHVSYNIHFVCNMFLECFLFQWPHGSNCVHVLLKVLLWCFEPCFVLMFKTCLCIHQKGQFHLQNFLYILHIIWLKLHVFVRFYVSNTPCSMFQEKDFASGMIALF
jgi:hypothetical protein